MKNVTTLMMAIAAGLSAAACDSDPAAEESWGSSTDECSDEPAGSGTGDEAGEEDGDGDGAGDGDTEGGETPPTVEQLDVVKHGEGEAQDLELTFVSSGERVGVIRVSRAGPEEELGVEMTLDGELLYARSVDVALPLPGAGEQCASSRLDETWGDIDLLDAAWNDGSFELFELAIVQAMEEGKWMLPHADPIDWECEELCNAGAGAWGAGVGGAVGAGGCAVVPNPWICGGAAAGMAAAGGFVAAHYCKEWAC